MSKSLIIAEKPSVAADLAKALGKVPKKWRSLRERRIRHLVRRRSSRGARDAGGHRQEEIRLLAAGNAADHSGEIRPQADRGFEERFNQLKKLLARKDVDTVINACDAGREGELIFDNIYRLTKSKLPVKRAWMQTMTAEGIREAFKKLRDGEQMAGLADAARCRSESDWLIGINGTRAMTKRMFGSRGRQRRLGRSRADAHARHRLRPRTGDPEFQAARLLARDGQVRSRARDLRRRLSSGRISRSAKATSTTASIASGTRRSPRPSSPLARSSRWRRSPRRRNQRARLRRGFTI